MLPGGRVTPGGGGAPQGQGPPPGWGCPRGAQPALPLRPAVPQAVPGQLRAQGNELFQAGDYEAALAAYTRALGLCDRAPERAVLHRNRAACHLKLVRPRGRVCGAGRGGTGLHTHMHARQPARPIPAQPSRRAPTRGLEAAPGGRGAIWLPLAARRGSVPEPRGPLTRRREGQRGPGAWGHSPAGAGSRGASEPPCAAPRLPGAPSRMGPAGSDVPGARCCPLAPASSCPRAGRGTHGSC